MDSGYRVQLWTIPGFQSAKATVVKGTEHCSDAMRISNMQKPIDALHQLITIVLPHQIMQVDPCGVEADAGGPSQFTVDGVRIEGIPMPELKKIDSGRRQEVETADPWVRPPPALHFSFRPTVH